MVPVLLLSFAMTSAVVEAQMLRATRNAREALRQEGANRLGPESPRIVCGMKLIPADPNVDPKIRIVAPTKPDHKIQAIRPEICVE